MSRPVIPPDATNTQATVVHGRNSQPRMPKMSFENAAPHLAGSS